MDSTPEVAMSVLVELLLESYNEFGATVKEQREKCADGYVMWNDKIPDDETVTKWKQRLEFLCTCTVDEWLIDAIDMSDDDEDKNTEFDAETAIMAYGFNLAVEDNQLFITAFKKSVATTLAVDKIRERVTAKGSKIAVTKVLAESLRDEKDVRWKNVFVNALSNVEFVTSKVRLSYYTQAHKYKTTAEIENLLVIFVPNGKMPLPGNSI